MIGRALRTFRRRIAPHRKRHYWNRIANRVDPHELTACLQRLGLRKGITVFVHSALSRLGYLPGGAATLIEILRKLIGVQGTIVMPSFPFTGPMDDFVASSPLFDIAATPPRSGLVTEVFRRRDDVVRSLHPTHPVCALGANAAEIVSGHENCMTPCGPDSPYGRLADLDAVGLRIGTGAQTLYHHIQELVDMPNLFLDNPITLPCVGNDGRRRHVTTRVHRKLIPSVLFLDNAKGSQLFSVHCSDFPLLFSGDRQAAYERDLRRKEVLRHLLAIRQDFVTAGHMSVESFNGCQIESFRIKEYTDYAVEKETSLISRYRSLYSMNNIQAMLRAGEFPRENA